MTPDTSLETAGAIDLTVVIPVYNEREGLVRCHEAVTATLTTWGRPFEIVYVDDGSRDGSVEIMERLVAADSNATAVFLHRNHGQQRALWAGLHYAKGRVIATFDSDLQCDPSCLPELAEIVLSGFEMAAGIRRNRKDAFLTTRLPSIIGQRLVNSALGVNQTDFGAARAYNRRLVEALKKVAPSFVILPAAAFREARSFKEIPIQSNPRVSGETKWSAIRRMEFYFDLFTAYAPRPFEWMMVSGGVLLALSALLSVGIVIYRILMGPNFAGTIIFFDVFLGLTGLNLFALSLIGEFVVRLFRIERHLTLDDIVDSAAGRDARASQSRT